MKSIVFFCIALLAAGCRVAPRYDAESDRVAAEVASAASVAPASTSTPPLAQPEHEPMVRCGTGGTPRSKAKSCAFAGGSCCYQTEAQACSGAGCGGKTCTLSDDVPRVAHCGAPLPPQSSGRVARCGVGGTPQVATGLCPVMFGTCCYQKFADACREAGCTTKDCSLSKSSPPQAVCDASGT